MLSLYALFLGNSGFAVIFIHSNISARFFSYVGFLYVPLFNRSVNEKLELQKAFM